MPRLPSAKPLALAARPASAAPSAKPICWTVATDEAYQLDYITVLTTHQGLITRYRDYWNPLAAASAAGTLPELLGSLRSQATR